MHMVDVEKRLADLAAGQWGLVTTPQATSLGVTHSHLNRLAEREVITRLSHGVYRLRSAPSDRHIDLRGAWLALEPTLTAGQRLQNPNDGPIVSHASAASLRGWGELTAYDSEFTFVGRRQTRRGAVRIHRGSTPKADVEIVDGLPSTTAERLIADLLAADYDTDHIGAVLAGAIRDRSIDLEHLAVRVAPYAKRRGFDHLAGDALVFALIRSGDAHDEALADSLVRLAKVSDYRRSPHFTRHIAQLAGADLLKIEDVVATLSEHGVLERIALAKRILEDPATIRAITEARKLV
jgi:Transcriptional regulator, AbiEi antitoxin